MAASFATIDASVASWGLSTAILSRLSFLFKHFGPREFF